VTTPGWSDPGVTAVSVRLNLNLAGSEPGIWAEPVWGVTTGLAGRRLLATAGRARLAVTEPFSSTTAGLDRACWEVGPGTFKSDGGVLPGLARPGEEVVPGSARPGEAVVPGCAASGEEATPGLDKPDFEATAGLLTPKPEAAAAGETEAACAAEALPG